MKTRHIIAIGLLSALAVAVLGIAIHTGKAKPKTLQTKAEYNIIEFSLPTGTNETHQVNLNIDGNKKVELQEANLAIYYSYDLNFTKSGNTPTNYFTQTLNIDEVDIAGYTYYPDNDTPHSFNISGEIELLNYYLDVRTVEIANNSLYIEAFITTTYRINNETYNDYSQQEFAWQEPVNASSFENIYDYIIDEIETEDTIYTLYNTLNNYANGSYAEGYTEGYDTGYAEGIATGYQNGKDVGYGIGYNDSEAFNHPIALQPLMLNILTMPFTFISQAFDVTLWPGTAYEFNIANFIKGMIAIATIMFIIKLFTSGFSIIGNYASNIRNESNMRSAQRQKNRASKIHKASKDKKE